MKKKSLWLILALMTALLVALSACNRGGDEGPDTPPAPPIEGQVTPPTPPVDIPVPPPPIDIQVGVDALADLRELETLFPRVGYNRGQAGILPRGAEGNIFLRGIPSASPFPGIFNPHLSSDAADGTIQAKIIYGLISTNDSLMFTNTGPVNWELELNTTPPAALIPYIPFVQDEDGNDTNERIQIHRFRYIQVQELNWHDGVPVTLADMYYAFWMVSHPRSQTIRFGTPNSTSNVVGVHEWRQTLYDSPEMDNFFVLNEVLPMPGIVLHDCHRIMDVYLISAPPSMLYGGIIITPLPWHHFQEVDIRAKQEHPNSRDNMLGFGPFIIDQTRIIPGMEVFFMANDNYWQGPPLMDGIHLFHFAPDLQPMFMREGLVDMQGFRHADWLDYGDTNNVQILGRINNSFRFLYFNLGVIRNYGDGAGNVMVPRTDNHPITDVRFRRAMAYAVDNHTLNMTIHNGFRRCANGPLSPFNAEPWINPYDAGTAVFDPDRAREILDEAGFLVDPATGWRTDLNGDPFVINFVMAGSSENNYITFFHWQQGWHDIGVNVQLYNDDFIVHGTFVSNYLLAQDIPYNPDWHMFEMGFALGWSPSPSGLWASNQQLNLARYSNPVWDEILADIHSADAWDPEFLGDAMRRWNEAFMESLPAVPQVWIMGLTYVNNRVAGWDLNRYSFHPNSNGWHQIGLTASTPYVHQ